MFSPYSDVISRFTLMFDPNLLEKVLAAGTRVEQEKVFLDELADAQSPYEFFGIIWNESDTTDDYPFDVSNLIVDHIVNSKDKWDPDQVACFLLELAQDHPNFVDDPSWLIKVNLPGMLERDFASNLIDEMFGGGHRDLIMKLAEYYQWDEILAQARQAEE